MYSGPLNEAHFRPDESHFRFAKERAELSRSLSPLVSEETPDVLPHEREEKKWDLTRLLEKVSPEDSALIALIVFLLCDNTDNDVVLLGILLYVLLSK